MSKSATAAPAQTTTCPAWCTDTEGVYGLHLGEVHEVGELALCLSQDSGEAAPTIGLNDNLDQELTLTLEEAEQLGKLLLQLARTGRKAAFQAA
jgi:hypothetical protein